MESSGFAKDHDRVLFGVAVETDVVFEAFDGVKVIDPSVVDAFEKKGVLEIDGSALLGILACQTLFKGFLDGGE